MPAGRNPKRVAENVGRLRHPPHPRGSTRNARGQWAATAPSDQRAGA
jgi:hypothetical protein